MHKRSVALLISQVILVGKRFIFFPVSHVEGYILFYNKELLISRLH